MQLGLGIALLGIVQSSDLSDAEVQKLQVCEEQSRILSDQEIIDGAIAVLLDNIHRAIDENTCPICDDPTGYETYGHDMFESQNILGAIEYHSVEAFKEEFPHCCRFSRDFNTHMWKKSVTWDRMQGGFGGYVFEVTIDYQLKEFGTYPFRSAHVYVTPCGGPPRIDHLILGRPKEDLFEWDGRRNSSEN